ncbi:ACT domain-containing protein [Novipirellula rosea]|uniref:ACT domain-containing protein n=1 Tax=Novipirellula rosea TaxID=1031540 RepID=A0ABP8MD09_9BACT
MNGETHLPTLLEKMKPELQTGEFVFCTMAPEAASKLRLSAIGQFLEPEGLTLILAKGEAETNGLEFAYPCRMITLKIHSSLEAVGFLAAVTDKLAHRGISVNAISAYFHDHLFVPTERAEEAMDVLNDIVKGRT